MSVYILKVRQVYLGMANSVHFLKPLCAMGSSCSKLFSAKYVTRNAVIGHGASREITRYPNLSTSSSTWTRLAMRLYQITVNKGICSDLQQFNWCIHVFRSYFFFSCPRHAGSNGILVLETLLQPSGNIANHALHSEIHKRLTISYYVDHLQGYRECRPLYAVSKLNKIVQSRCE